MVKLGELDNVRDDERYGQQLVRKAWADAHLLFRYEAPRQWDAYADVKVLKPDASCLCRGFCGRPLRQMYDREREWCLEPIYRQGLYAVIVAGAECCDCLGPSSDFVLETRFNDVMVRTG